MNKEERTALNRLVKAMKTGKCSKCPVQKAVMAALDAGMATLKKQLSTPTTL